MAATVSSGLQLLEEARGLVAHGWCQGTDARAADGAPVDAWSLEASSWSLLGALVAVLEQNAATTGELALEELSAALYALANVIETDSLVAWNDVPEREQSEVLSVLEAASGAYQPPRATIIASVN